VVSRWSDPRKSRGLLVLWIIGVFAISAATDLRVLAGAAAAAALVFCRGLARNLRRVVRSVIPVTVGLSAISWGFLYALQRHPPPLAPFAALALRTVTIAFVTFSVLDRVSLLRAVAPWPTLTRLLVITLAQIHALRLLASESLLGLRSRLVRKPRAVDFVRSAGGITGALFTLSSRNARDVSDAMRSRGF
jgi:cobalt/nickel transport system permease protein